MRLQAHVDAVREDLARVAAVGDETTARAAELLAVALDSSVARRFQDALTEAALELSSQLDQGRVEVRVAAGDPELVFVGEPADQPADAEPADLTLDARITLRLPTGLKARLESAAAASGQSLNAWLVHTLRGAAEPRRSSGAGRRRLTGYGRS